MRTRLRSKVTLLFIVCAALLAVAGTAMALTTDTSGNTAPAPTIQSDQADYPPGATVTLTGSNWQPGESVNIVVNDDVGQTWNRNVNVTADANGQVQDQFQLPDWFVATYNVKATGANGAVATTSFTDGNVQSATIDARTTTGNPATCTTTVATTFQSGSAVCARAQVTVQGGGNTNWRLQWYEPGKVPGTDAPVRDTQFTETINNGTGPPREDIHTVSTTGTWTLVVCKTAGSCNTNQQVNTTTFTVGRPTTTTVARTTGSNPSTYGDNLTFTATVTATGGNPNNAGTVTFKDEGNTISGCSTPVTLSGNTAACSPSKLPAGNHNITAEYSGMTTGSPPFFSSSTSSQLSHTVNKKALTVNGVTAADKIYDGNASATINTSGASLNGVVSGDTVNLVTSGAFGSFANKNVGTGKTVTISGLSLSGSSASNYTLTQPTATANITAKPIVGSFTADNKVYDGNTSATVLTRTLGAAVATGDTVSLSGGTATFDNKNVGTGKTVTLTGATLSGVDASNYNLTSVNTAKADITARLIVGTFTAADKVYDGNASATITGRSLLGVVGTDDVSLSGGTATFNDKNVGNDKPVSDSGFSLAGADKDNYTLSSVANTTADITPKGLTGSFTAANKVYDGNTSATISGSSLGSGVVNGDQVSIDGSSATAQFNDKNVGTGKAVTGTGFTLSGTDAGNYTLSSVANTTADITAKSVTGSFTAANKIWDGNNSVTITSRSLTGVISPDVVTLTGGTATFDNANVGQNKTVTGTGFTLSGTGAGNYTLASSTLTTTASIMYNYSGFLQPINDTAHQTDLLQSKFKLGQTIPVKFELRDAAGNLVQQTPNPTFSKVFRGACDSTTALEAPVAVTPDAGTQYIYTGGQYHYNWSTKGLQAGEWRIYANLADGNPNNYVDICLTK